ncbi:hypothetical protein ACFY9G_36735 [Streptomyces anthocyanicus]|uniref:hypothetical protein n=1 Tax=Streptomyces anthocyanicus TaxID=68174 RepID=UPI0036E1A3BC
MTKQLRPLLDDPAAGVVRETVTALLPSAKELHADWLLERTNSERPRHVRVGALRLLDARGGIVALRTAAEHGRLLRRVRGLGGVHHHLRRPVQGAGHQRLLRLSASC